MPFGGVLFTDPFGGVLFTDRLVPVTNAFRRSTVHGLSSPNSLEVKLAEGVQVGTPVFGSSSGAPPAAAAGEKDIIMLKNMRL